MEIVTLLKVLPGSFAQGLIWGIMALGVFITYKVLDYADLTVDGSLCTGAAIGAMAIIGGVNPYIAMVLAFGGGMIAGLVTGILHTKFGIPAILSGILTQLALYSINMRIMGRATQALSIDQYNLIFSMRNVPQAIGISLIFVIAVIGALYWFFGTEIGCAVRSTGDNEAMSRAQGINTNVTKIIGLMISNGIVGLSGGLLAQYQGSADIQMGRGAIVIGLAAVIIGQVVFGNRFNFSYKLGSIVGGAIIYYLVIALVLQMGLSTTDLKLFSAITVAVFLAIPYIKSNNRRRGVKNA